MRPEVKSLWLDALRSGDYAQGVSQLRSHDESGERYCCLGVLCDLHSQWTETTWRETEITPATPYRRYWYGDSGNKYYLPIEVAFWAGLHSPDPWVTAADGPAKLSVLNDQGADFGTIAELIERDL